MHTPIGPWADRRVSDTQMLLRLAHRDHTAAIGVLANPNLSDAEFNEVLGVAALTPRNLRIYPAPQALTSAVTVDRQVAIVIAAAKVGTSSALALLPTLGAPAASKLLRRCLREPFRNSRPVLDQIVVQVAGNSWDNAPEDAMLDLYAEALPHLPYGAQDALATLALHVRSRENVIRLGDLFATCSQADAVYGDQLIDALLSATFEHDDVPLIWARWHELGQLVAAGDPRQDPKILDAMDVPARLRAQFNELRDNNPSRTGVDLRQELRVSFQQQLESPSKEKFQDWAAASAKKIALLAAGPANGTGPSTDAELDAVLAALPAEAHTLTRVLLFLQMEDPTTSHVDRFLTRDSSRITTAMRVALWPKMSDTPVALLKPYAQQAHHFMRAAHTKANAPVRDTQPPVDAPLTEQQDLAEFTCSRLFGVNIVNGEVRATHSNVLDHVESAEGWLTLDSLATGTHSPTALKAFELLAEAVTAEASVPRYSTLFGNPLGELV